MPVNQLIWFYEDKLYKPDEKSKVTFVSDEDVESEVLEDGHLSQSNSDNDFPSDTECCQRTRNYTASNAPLKSTNHKLSLYLAQKCHCHLMILKLLIWAMKEQMLRTSCYIKSKRHHLG